MITTALARMIGVGSDDIAPRVMRALLPEYTDAWQVAGQAQCAVRGIGGHSSKPALNTACLNFTNQNCASQGLKVRRLRVSSMSSRPKRWSVPTVRAAGLSLNFFTTPTINFSPCSPAARRGSNVRPGGAHCRLGLSAALDDVCERRRRRPTHLALGG